jgi:hypothetical protein
MAIDLHVHVRDLTQALSEHPLYKAIDGETAIRCFMRTHVFCVWDFMSLLGSLRRELTCVEVPWWPTQDPRARRLVNELVLDEESDETPDGRFVSHFELYLEAMEQCGADTAPIHGFLRLLRSGVDVEVALASAELPAGVARFVSHTLAVARRGALHERVAAFTVGREMAIPPMFKQLIAGLPHGGPQWTLLRYYLERHVVLDGGHHTDAASALLAGLCAGDDDRSRAALAAARAALAARIELWTSLHRELASSARGVSTRVPAASGELSPAI